MSNKEEIKNVEATEEIKPPERPARPSSRIVRTMLDEIPEGTEQFFEEERNKTRKEKKLLPEGIHSKALYRDVFKIAWPSFIELTLTSLVSMVDMMMVGTLGPWAITAVGLATQPRFIFMMMIMSMNTGATATVARARGAGDHEKANRVLKQAMLLCFILAVIGTAGGLLLADPLVRFMANDGIPESTMMAGVDYLNIQMAGFVFMAMTTMITGALRGTGNSRTSMVYNITANIVNVIFNWLLINGNLGFPKMGVQGASLATIIGQAVGCAIAFYTILSGKYYLKLRFRGSWKPDKEILGSITRVGFPALGENVIMRVGMILFARTVASLGEVSMATHQICMNIQSLSFMNGQAFAVSATSLVGQSLGKKRPDMAEHYSTRCRRLGLCVSIFLGLMFGLFGKYFVMLYNTEPDVVNTGAMIMLFVAGIQPVQCSQFVLAGALRGAGDTRITALITLVTVLIVRTGLGYLLVPILGMGLIGAWIAIISDQALRSALVLWRYNTGKWKKIRI